MQQSAERIADYGVDELASQSLGRIRAKRLQSLAADPDAPPFFGRTDRDNDDPSGRNRESFHIGRRHVRDERGDPIVIDWRAPIARAFYRATPADRMGVTLRRRFGFHVRGGRLSSFEDEHLDRGEALGLASDLLRQEIERPRVGPMRDIVATIQPDQDDLVRADLDTSLCIQGAPGTGKTAVGLHRAAYLLYTYPDRLRRSGVLVVGPNAAFLHYIAQVLPSLGEGGIEQATVGELVGTESRGSEPVELATPQGRRPDGRRAAPRGAVEHPQAHRGRARHHRHPALPGGCASPAPLRRRRAAGAGRRAALVDRARPAADAGRRGRAPPARGRRGCAHGRGDREDVALAGDQAVRGRGVAGADRARRC